MRTSAFGVGPLISNPKVLSLQVLIGEKRP
jgi:hypothetical protein